MKRIGLVAHDKKKAELVKWAVAHEQVLAQHKLWGTGTTGRAIAEATQLDITLLKSGPLGGDAQLGGLIVEEQLDVCIFFIDPLTAMPHDVDVKALIRLAILYDVAFAFNPKTADAVLSVL